MVLVSSIYAVVSKNPDARYQPMRDDRGSFIKSQTALNTELDALAVTARGDGMTTYKSRTIDDDDESFSSESVSQQKEGHRPLSNVGSPGPDRRHDVDTSYREPPRSPIDPSVPLFPGNGSASTGRAAPPQEYYGSPRYGNVGYGGHAGFNDGGGGGGGGSSGGYGRAQHLRPDARYRQQHSGSPWQQGAGYE